MTTKGIAGYNRAIIPVVRDASAETERAAQERQRYIAKYVQREGADAKRDGACTGVAGAAATVTGALFMKAILTSSLGGSLKVDGKRIPTTLIEGNGLLATIKSI